MGSIVEDIKTSADWMAHALQSSGYRADFSPASLWEIDRFFDEHARKGIAKRGGLFAEDLGQRLFALGAYVGEVVRRTQGGVWMGVDSDPAAEINAELILPGEIHCWPVQRAIKRFQNGAEDSIAVWGHGLGLQVGARPATASRSFLKRLLG